MYNQFAHVYDILMRDTEYDKWVDFYSNVFKRLDITPRLVLDLACGTGEITARMMGRGYDMIAIDISPDMLSIAAQKAPGALLLEQDMCELELYGTVDAIVCAMDSVNYITEQDKLFNTFSLVNNYLNPDGVFIFDVNTRYKLKNILDGNVFVHDQDGVFCVWESVYYPDNEVCGFYLNFFIREGELFRRYYEEHEQRSYSNDELCTLIESAGMRVEGIYGGLNFEQVTESSERAFFVVTKRG